MSTQEKFDDFKDAIAKPLGSYTEKPDGTVDIIIDEAALKRFFGAQDAFAEALLGEVEHVFKKVK